MRGHLNDALRRVVGLALVALGLVLEIRQRVQILRYRSAQARLKRRYAIGESTPVLPYGPEQRANIAAAMQRFRGYEPVAYATTSGSTAEPKRIPYPAERIRRARWGFIDAFARAFAKSPLRRHVFYAFSSLTQNDSLTSMMMAEKRRPPFLAALQAPYRLQGDAALQALAGQYGEPALRLWVIALSNPGVLYSTNPSTLSTFLDGMRRDWIATTALIRDFVSDPGRFPGAAHAMARRLTSRGAPARLRRIAGSDAPLPLAEIAPAVHTHVCWTGGYVEPFLRRLAEHLPEPRYRLLPMFSMSTETPETTPCFRGNPWGVAFVPLAAGVLYEFLPEGAADEPASLVSPHLLQAGQSYSMVVSDAYGLRRYQTDDLFSCVGHVSGLPDLRFLRRRSLSYSFTGEKLTGEQVSMALERLRAEFPELGGESFLTCMPSFTKGRDALPHYRLIHVLRRAEEAAFALDAAVARCDDLLAEINGEYRAKRASGRLGPMAGGNVSLDGFLRRVAGANRESWEAQFKFLPLYAHMWEDDGERDGVN